MIATIHRHSKAKEHGCKLNERLYERSHDGCDKVKDVWQFKIASCDSPCIELATYKFSLRG